MKKLILLLTICLFVQEAKAADELIEYCMNNESSRFSACLEEQKEYKQRFYGAAMAYQEFTGKSFKEIVNLCSESLVKHNYLAATDCILKQSKAVDLNKMCQ